MALASAGRGPRGIWGSGSFEADPVGTAGDSVVAGCGAPEDGADAVGSGTEGAPLDGATLGVGAVPTGPGATNVGAGGGGSAMVLGSLGLEQARNHAVAASASAATWALRVFSTSRITALL